MKYLKMFNEGFETNDYYVEIPDVEGVSIIDISSKNISKIRDLGLDIKSGKSPIMTSDGGLLVEMVFVNSSNSGGQSWAHRTFCVIIECEDEYFLVKMSEGSISKNYTLHVHTCIFKCDQWDGLVKLLLDKGFIK